MHYTRVLLILIIFYSFSIEAQINSQRIKIIEGVTSDLLWGYVSYDKAKEMGDFLNNKFKTGGYDTTLNRDEFCYELTKDLREFSKDEHIYIMAPFWKNRSFSKPIRNKSPKLDIEITRKGKLTTSSKIKWWLFNSKIDRKLKRAKRRFKDKFTYGSIKILPGNIGYFEVYDFQSTSYKRKNNKGRIKLKSVMRFLKNTNSIIIDFRANTGGYISLSKYFTSFFVNKPNSYFISSDISIRKDTISDEVSIPNDKGITRLMDDSLPQKDNSKFAQGKDIYALTSNATFSAAELTLYALKKFSKITIIGEPTRGGGNGHYGAYCTPYFAAIIPCVKIYDKDRNSGIFSITPDSIVKSENAFQVAYSKAYSKLPKFTLSKSKTRYYKRRNEAEFENSKLVSKLLPYHIGDFRKIQIQLINDQLYLIYDKEPPQKMKPISTNYFKTEYFRSVRFIQDNDNGISIQVKWFNGTVETFRKL